jgi:hypothetical protein
MYTRVLNIGNEVDSAALPLHLADCLRGVHARDVTTEANQVRFTGGIFRFVNSSNILVPFGYGDVTIDANRRLVQYRLSFRQLMIVVLAVTLLVPISAAIESRDYGFLPAIPLFWLFLVGANLAIGLGRFESFLQRAIETAPHLR